MKQRKAIWEYIKKGRFLALWRDGIVRLRSRLYQRRAQRLDRRIGGISAGSVLPTKYPELGAYTTQSSDYRCLKRVFRDAPLQSDDVFIDVGCGEGRVLTWLYLRGFRGQAVGIELDPAVARTAAQRTAACENIRIICGNVLEQKDVFAQATAIYLFNPFSRQVLREFVELLETVCKKPARLYYLKDLYRDELTHSGRWSCQCSDVIRRPGCKLISYSIHLLSPSDQL